MNTKKLMKRAPLSPLPRLVLLALFFFAGVLLGQVLASRVSAETGEELRQYLQGYMRLEGGSSTRTAVATAVVYFRYPVLAFLLGFSSIGVVLLPLTTAACGFFFSFSVCCFTATFGGGGVLLSLAVFGLRCLVTLPCYFLVASASWGAAVGLASGSVGSGRTGAPVVYGAAYWKRLGMCCLALLGGVCLDLMISPWLTELVLEQLVA